MPQNFIPDGSIMTEAMITYWTANFGRTRAESIGDLDDIESGRVIPPSDLTAIFTPLTDKGASIMQRDARNFPFSARPTTSKNLGAVAAISAAIASAVVAVGLFTTLTATTISATSITSGSITGTAITGTAITGNVPNTLAITMTNSTTTPCAVRNTSGSARWLLAITAEQTGSTSSLGTITFTAGTTTSAFSAISFTNFIDTTLVKENGIPSITTTSTLMSSYGLWKNNEWLVFKSSTGTNVGTCKAVYQ